MASLRDERERLLEGSQQEAFPYTVSVEGVTLTIERGVFSPKYFRSTEIFAAALPFREEPWFIDIGCGCGALGIVASKRGARRVLCSDIAIEAVRNTTTNVRRLGLIDRIDVAQMDASTGLRGQSLIGSVMWNFPWIYSPAKDDCWKGHLYRAISDPGYRSLERLSTWFSGVGSRGDGLRLFIGLGSFANEMLIQRILRRAGLAAETVATQPDPIDARMVYRLVRLYVGS